MVVGEVVFGEDNVLEFCGGTYSEVDRENREWRWCQTKSVYRLHLDLVVKQLCYISCLNVVLLILPLSEINSYVVALSFYIKMMKRRTLQGCRLSHSIKKAMFYV